MIVEPDPQLRRIERTAVIVGVTVVLLAGFSGGGWRAMLGACAGALLVVVSWLGVRSGVDAVLQVRAPESAWRRRGSMVGRLVKFITRFAILAVFAYVMMVRLRAQPWWMLAGATSVAAAPVVELFRQLRARSQS